MAPRKPLSCQTAHFINLFRVSLRGSKYKNHPCIYIYFVVFELESCKLHCHSNLVQIKRCTVNSRSRKLLTQVQSAVMSCSKPRFSCSEQVEFPQRGVTVRKPDVTVTFLCLKALLWWTVQHIQIYINKLKEKINEWRNIMNADASTQGTRGHWMVWWEWEGCESCYGHQISTQKYTFEMNR